LVKTKKVSTFAVPKRGSRKAKRSGANPDDKLKRDLLKSGRQIRKVKAFKKPKA